MYIPESSSVTLPPTADVLDEVEPGANTRLNRRVSLCCDELNVSIEA